MGHAEWLPAATRLTCQENLKVRISFLRARLQKRFQTAISIPDENYTGAWTACATKRTPKAAQTRLMVSNRG